MIDFFNSTCSEEPRRDALFGLCDDKNDEKAYSSIDETDVWIAIVHNERQIDVQFTPIDHCIDIRKPKSKDRESTCDGMLTFEDSIYLVELKNSRTRGWRSDAIKQLRNTALLMKEELKSQSFNHKKAYASNRRRQNVFQESHISQSKQFQIETGFLLFTEAKIIID